MKLKAAILTVVMAVSVLAGAGPASSGVGTDPVLATGNGEFQPAVGPGAMAWEENTSGAPNNFNVYLRPTGGQKIKVNAPGTRAANGGIFNGRLAYQEYSGGSSDIQYFNIGGSTRSDPTDGINTKQWEYWPSVSDQWMLFGRLYENGSRRIILFDQPAGRGEVLAKSKKRSRFLGPGQVNGDFATWYKCTPKTCNVFRYQISTSEVDKIENPGRFQRASSVGADGTVYFIRSEKGCGRSVRLMAAAPDGTITLLVNFADGQDSHDTYAMSIADGETEVYHENSSCGAAHRSDVFKAVHVSGFELTVEKTGTGDGTVTSDPAGIDCGTVCVAPFDANTEVTLTAVAAAGSTLVGWTGEGCADTPTCTVTMDEAKSVTADFQGPPGTHRLEVAKIGEGNGTITSTPTGINCGTDCSQEYASGTGVTLSAAPAAGSTFAGWSGAGCSGTGTCIVSMTEARTIVATFSRSNTLTVTKLPTAAAGTVNGNGITCGSDCSENYLIGTSVTLSAGAHTGFTFTSWSNCDNPNGAVCTMTMNTAKSVVANFTPIPRTLTVQFSGTGSGTVTGTNSLSCPSPTTCTKDYDHGTNVTLNAAAPSGSTFTGWSGAGCTGTGACIVTMDAAKTVTATFDLIPQQTLTVNFAGTGGGTVTGTNGLSCPSPTTCNKDYNQGTLVTLTAAPDGTSTFGAWTGDCDTTPGNDCTVTMDAAKSVTATFDPGPYLLAVTLAGDGLGTVTSSPTGIDCSNEAGGASDCNENYAAGTPVTLTASTTTASHTFTGWSGDCTPSGNDCMTTMNAAKNVTATFDNPLMFLPRQQAVGGWSWPLLTWERVLCFPSAGAGPAGSCRS